MLFLKSAYKQLKMNPFMNVLIAIQLAAVISILFVLVSLIESRLEYYMPFREEFSSQGYLCNIDVTDLEKDIEEAIGDAQLVCSYWDYLMVNDQDAATDPIAETYIYSDKYLDAFTPTMESGEWLDKNSEYDGVLHAVVTPNNPMNLKLGDEFTLSNVEGVSQKAVVIGVVGDSQYTVGASFFSQTDMGNNNNFFDMYYTYNSEVEVPSNHWGIYLTEEEYKSSNFYTGDMIVYGMAFVLTEGLSYEEHQQVGEAMMTNWCAIYIRELSEINANSFDHIKEQLYILLPIALCIFALTIITSISVISISVSGQLKTYAVYYICGAKWSSCSLISLIYSLFICIVSSAISVCALLVIKNRTDTVISFELWEIATMVVTVLLFIILSALIPLAITHGNQPKEILKKE